MTITAFNKEMLRVMTHKIWCKLIITARQCRN